MRNHEHAFHHRRSRHTGQSGKTLDVPLEILVETDDASDFIDVIVTSGPEVGLFGHRKRLTCPVQDSVLSSDGRGDGDALVPFYGW
jgi:hypothetical protein